jgi:glucokinase
MAGLALIKIRVGDSTYHKPEKTVNRNRGDMYLGIEIGGTKLQVALGNGDGRLAGLWRAAVDTAAGAEGIRRQILQAVPQLLQESRLERSHVHGVGIGFGGPVDDATNTVIKSHQIAGWDNFTLADWISKLLGWPAILGNDADVAGLAETLFGAGKGLSPIFYITIGSGIGGGLIVNEEIYRGCGRGAAEIGHLKLEEARWGKNAIVESIASGWGMVRQAGMRLKNAGPPITVPVLVEAARQGDREARQVLNDAIEALAWGICHVIVLLAPRRVIIGGGVSLLGEENLFAPLRLAVAANVFAPFANDYDIVPAALGEEVVVHGALALARKRLR